MSHQIENPVLLNHNSPNGHWSECWCDLCGESKFDPIGFYGCTCNDCDPISASDAIDVCETRHRAICDCGNEKEFCLKYHHDRLSIDELRSVERCDCRACFYDPQIPVCKSGCPICSHDLFIAHMREHYLCQNDDQPLIVETVESRMYKYEIQQWKSPASFWVIAISKGVLPEPVAEVYTLDISDAKNCIDEMIMAESPRVNKIEFI